MTQPAPRYRHADTSVDYIDVIFPPRPDGRYEVIYVFKDGRVVTPANYSLGTIASLIDDGMWLHDIDDIDPRLRVSEGL